MLAPRTTERKSDRARPARARADQGESRPAGAPEASDAVGQRERTRPRPTRRIARGQLPTDPARIADARDGLHE
jgi:hypothetical protein